MICFFFPRKVRFNLLLPKSGNRRRRLKREREREVLKMSPPEVSSDPLSLGGSIKRKRSFLEGSGDVVSSSSSSVDLGLRVHRHIGHLTERIIERLPTFVEKGQSWEMNVKEVKEREKSVQCVFCFTFILLPSPDRLFIGLRCPTGLHRLLRPGIAPSNHTGQSIKGAISVQWNPSTSCVEWRIQIRSPFWP